MYSYSEALLVFQSWSFSVSSLLLRCWRLFAEAINPQRQLHSAFCRIEPKLLFFVLGFFFCELNGRKLHNADGNAQAFSCEGISAVPVAKSCFLLCILWWFKRINEKKIAEARRCHANPWTLMLLLFFRACLFSLPCSCWELKTGFRYERERERWRDMQSRCKARRMFQVLCCFS